MAEAELYPSGIRVWFTLFCMVDEDAFDRVEGIVILQFAVGDVPRT